MPRALRALVPCVPRALLALVSCMLPALRALVPHVSRALHALVTTVLSCPTCLVPYVHRALRAPVVHMPRASCASCFVHFPYVTYCFVPSVLYVLISPFLLLSFHASHFHTLFFLPTCYL